MEHLIEQPDALGGRHAMVQVHKDLDCLEKEHVVELRWDQLLVLVEGGEPRGDEL